MARIISSVPPPVAKPVGKIERETRTSPTPLAGEATPLKTPIYRTPVRVKQPVASEEEPAHVAAHHSPAKKAIVKIKK
jgi:hypothetical protein